MDFKLTTPVAFIIFNRPDVTFKVFERIRQAKPDKLFIIADGSREGKIGEAEKCAQCRTIKDMVDWNCEVHINFAEKNMGCKNRVYSGISWVFENVDEAIILEDDCLPSASFFRFCQELLEKYRYDTRVTVISGSNHNYLNGIKESYGFVSGTFMWGWATWKRAWKLNDIDMTLWPECRKNKYLKRILSQKHYLELSNAFQATYEGKIDTWDYQFAFANYLNHSLDIVPKVNMIRNIGFNTDATHTLNFLVKDAFYFEEEMEFPLVHPKIMLPLEDITESVEPNPSQEEILLDINQRTSTFVELINAEKYDAVIYYFKDTLKNSLSLIMHPNYIYFLAYAYLMKNDYEHAFSLADTLIINKVIPIQQFIIFARVFFMQDHFEEGFYIWNKILDILNIEDAFLKNELISAIKSADIKFLSEKYPNIQKWLTPPVLG